MRVIWGCTKENSRMMARTEKGLCVQVQSVGSLRVLVSYLQRF